MNKLTKAMLKGGIIGVAVVGAYALLVRPWILRWGATEEDVKRSLPGDDLVPDPDMGVTHAITIEAPADAVWPWLVQIGHKRAGWYSYDAIHRFLGVAGSVDSEDRSARRIIPELQDLDAQYQAAGGVGSRALTLGLRPTGSRPTRGVWGGSEYGRGCVLRLSPPGRVRGATARRPDLLRVSLRPGHP